MDIVKLCILAPYTVGLNRTCNVSIEVSIQVWCLWLISVPQCTVKKCGWHWHLFPSVCITTEFLVKEKQHKCSEHYVYALMPPVLECGGHEMQMNKMDINKHVKKWCMLSPNKKAGAVLLGNRAVEFCVLHIGWSKVGTICTPSFAEMLYKVSCPFSEESTHRNRHIFLFWGLDVWKRLQMKSITCKVKKKKGAWE